MIPGVVARLGAGYRAGRRAILSNVFSKVRNATKSGAFSSIALTFLVPLLGASKVRNGAKSYAFSLIFERLFWT